MLEFVVLANPPTRRRKAKRKKRGRAKARRMPARTKSGRFKKKSKRKKAPTTRKKAKKKAKKRKTVRTSSRSRSSAAKKAARTRARKKAARSRAAKKGARTRARRGGTRKKTTRRRRRRNPGGPGLYGSITKKRRRRTKKKGRTFKGKTYRPTIRRRKRTPARTYKRIRAAARGAKRYNPRHRRRRRNPALGLSLKGITRQLKSIATVKTAMGVGHGLIGASLALTIPPYVAKWTKQSMINRGAVGVLSSAIASVIAAAAAASLGFRAAAPRLLAGGLLATGSKALKLVLPAKWARWIPSISVGASPAAGPSLLRPGALPAFPGAAGLNAVMSPDQLVAGEAQAQGLGDWFSMKGLGGGVGQTYTVPRSSIAGGIGMGDYLYFNQYPQAPSAVGIPSFAPSAGETF